MFSINGSTPSIPAYPPVSTSPIDNDAPRHNPLEKNQIGDDAEIFNGNGGGKNVGNHFRADFNRKRIEQDFLSSDKKTGDSSQVSPRPPFSNMLPTDEKASDNSLININPAPIDFEIKSDGNGGWVKA